MSEALWYFQKTQAVKLASIMRQRKAAVISAQQPSLNDFFIKHPVFAMQMHVKNTTSLNVMCIRAP